MKIVFLDIDGVVNSSRSVIVKMGPKEDSGAALPLWTFAALDGEDKPEYGCLFGLRTVDPVCVALVNKLFEAGPTIQLVLSSTHRKFLWNSVVPFGSDAHLARLRAYLTAMGFKVPAAFSVTPVLHQRRGKEIEAWMDAATARGEFDGDTSEYVILDDDSDMEPWQLSFVRVNPEHGFSFSDYAQACKYLGLKEPGMVLL